MAWSDKERGQPANQKRNRPDVILKWVLNSQRRLAAYKMYIQKRMLYPEYSICTLFQTYNEPARSPR